MMTPSENCIWLASFDIGKKNFAFCIEEVNVSLLSQIENVPPKERYFKDGTCTPPFHKVIRDVCLNGQIILLDNVDLTNNTKQDKYLDPSIFVNMTHLLDEYKTYWDQCTSFVIEQQMGFGRKCNMMAIKLAQHCFSYFSFNFAQFKHTLEFPSYHKTKVLGATRKMSKSERKLWSVHRAIDILIDRNDKESLEKINNRKKKDDMADVIVQLQAYKYLVYIDKNFVV
jgi:hypothetical protein